MKKLLLILFFIPLIGFGQTDTKIEYWDILNIVQQPIQILVFAGKENLTNILFIENNTK